MLQFSKDTAKEPRLTGILTVTDIPVHIRGHIPIPSEARHQARCVYFVRAVPNDLQARHGKKHWRWKAGNDLTEASRSVPEFLVMTDRAIAEARGDVDALMEVVSRSPLAETPTSVVLEQEGMGPTDLYPNSLIKRHTGS